MTLRYLDSSYIHFQAQRQEVEENVIELLDEGLEFYTEMLETLDKTYHIGLEQYYDVLEIRSSDTKIRCALVSAQKCLLCLGDLARYKEMIQNTSNYGKARQYYEKARYIDTRNAKPFNQLAILVASIARFSHLTSFLFHLFTKPFNVHMYLKYCLVRVTKVVADHRSEFSGE